jgi:hypothetical protein
MIRRTLCVHVQQLGVDGYNNVMPCSADNLPSWQRHGLHVVVALCIA